MKHMSLFGFKQSGGWITVIDCKTCNRVTKVRISPDMLQVNGIFLIILWYTWALFYCLCITAGYHNEILISVLGTPFLNSQKPGQNINFGDTNLYMYLNTIWFHCFNACKSRNSGADLEEKVQNFRYFYGKDLAWSWGLCLCWKPPLYLIVSTNSVPSRPLAQWSKCENTWQLNS